MTQTALITGVTGQDGSYLAEYLLGRDYHVVGLHRRSSTDTTSRLDGVLDHPYFELTGGNLLDPESLRRTLRETQPDEIYNLAAQSHVGTSFDQPVYTARADALAVLHFLEAIRASDREIRFYQASTSELFGNVAEEPQDETTPYQPESPYATSKLFAHELTRVYRTAFDIPAVGAILFNHESPRRGPDFVTRKITRGAAAIASGEQDELRLGNLDARRDWGHARDYVQAMHLVLQQPLEEMQCYVVGTGETHTVRECAQIAFDEVGLDYKDHVVVDDEFYRPADVDVLRADPSRIERDLGWAAETSFEDLIREMVRADMGDRTDVPRPTP